MPSVRSSDSPLSNSATTYSKPPGRNSFHSHVDEEGRVCTSCQTYKCWSDYSVAKKRRSVCKVCQAARDKERYSQIGKTGLTVGNEKYILRLYGVTSEQFQTMWESQGGKCAICDRLLKNLSKLDKPHIDHCHESGQVRGILCHSCNTLLGHAKDNPEILQAAIIYLRSDNEDQKC